MGIQGLLPLLRTATAVTHLRELMNQTCAVDVYAWIHRGAYSCATELCVAGESDGYVSFCLSMLDLLLAHSITPIMVFDGARLGAKDGVERNRESKRATGLEEGKRLLSMGKSKEATNAFVRAVDVTPEMARKVALAFRKRGVQVVVAPFEADAQLAYLSHHNKVDFIVSEDSDCLPYGCRRVLFKLDKNGTGQLIDARRLRLADGIYLEHFSHEMFLDMCILAGCDYLESLPGVGIKTAHQLVQKYKKTDRILRGLRFEIKQVVPTDYEKRFYQAKLTFKHQYVFHLDGEKFGLLTSPPICPEMPSITEDLSFLGVLPPNAEAIASAWARGDINVETNEVFPEPVSSQLATKEPAKQHQMQKSHTLDSYFAYGHDKSQQTQNGKQKLIDVAKNVASAKARSSTSITSNPWVKSFHSNVATTPATTLPSKFFNRPSTIASLSTSTAAAPSSASEFCAVSSSVSSAHGGPPSSLTATTTSTATVGSSRLKFGVFAYASKPQTHVVRPCSSDDVEEITVNLPRQNQTHSRTVHKASCPVDLTTNETEDNGTIKLAAEQPSPKRRKLMPSPKKTNGFGRYAYRT